MISKRVMRKAAGRRWSLSRDLIGSEGMSPMDFWGKNIPGGGCQGSEGELRPFLLVEQEGRYRRCRGVSDRVGADGMEVGGQLQVEFVGP